jgi:hypothetical protein
MKGKSNMSNQSHIGSIVFVEYGKCAGLPALIGKGRITDEMTYKGETLVRVEPVEGMPLPKWIRTHEIIGYDWTENVKATTAETEAA